MLRIARPKPLTRIASAYCRAVETRLQRTSPNTIEIKQFVLTLVLNRSSSGTLLSEIGMLRQGEGSRLGDLPRRNIIEGCSSTKAQIRLAGVKFALAALPSTHPATHSTRTRARRE